MRLCFKWVSPSARIIMPLSWAVFSCVTTVLDRPRIKGARLKILCYVNCLHWLSHFSTVATRWSPEFLVFVSCRAADCHFYSWMCESVEHRGGRSAWVGEWTNGNAEEQLLEQCGWDKMYINSVKWIIFCLKPVFDSIRYLREVCSDFRDVKCILKYVHHWGPPSLFYVTGID